MSQEKSLYHETKEVVSRFRETINIKIEHRKTEKENGHLISVTLSLSPDDVDSMNKIDGAVASAILNSINIIENDLHSKYLGFKKS